MTVDEIEKSLSELKTYNNPWLTSKDVAKFFGVNPHSFHVQAEEDPSKLGCEVVVIGNQVKVPRIPFINYMNHVIKGV